MAAGAASLSPGSASKHPSDRIHVAAWLNPRQAHGGPIESRSGKEAGPAKCLTTGSKMV